LIVLGVLVQTLALACGCDVSCPFVMLGTPKVLLALDGFGLVLVSIGRWDFHPLGTFHFLFLFAFLSPILVFTLFVHLFGLYLLLLHLLNLGFQCKDLFLLGRTAFHVFA